MDYCQSVAPLVATPMDVNALNAIKLSDYPWGAGQLDSSYAHAGPWGADVSPAEPLDCYGKARKEQQLAKVEESLVRTARTTPRISHVTYACARTTNGGSVGSRTTKTPRTLARPKANLQLQLLQAKAPAKANAKAASSTKGPGSIRGRNVQKEKQLEKMERMPDGMVQLH